MIVNVQTFSKTSQQQERHFFAMKRYFILVRGISNPFSTSLLRYYNGVRLYLSHLAYIVSLEMNSRKCLNNPHVIAFKCGSYIISIQ